MNSWENLNPQRRVRKQGAETIAGDVADGTDRTARRGHAMLAVAAEWLRANRDPLQRAGHHPVPVLQERFGLSSKQAVAAIQLAHAEDAKAGAS